MPIAVAHINPELRKHIGYLLTANVYNNSFEQTGEAYRDLIISFFLFLSLDKEYLINQGSLDEIAGDFVSTLLGYTSDESFLGIDKSHPLYSASEKKILKQILCFLASISNSAKEKICKYLSQCSETDYFISDDDLTFEYSGAKYQAIFFKEANQFYQSVKYKKDVSYLHKLRSQNITLSGFNFTNGTVCLKEPNLRQLYELLYQKINPDEKCEHEEFFNKVLNYFFLDFVVPENSTEPSLAQLNNSALNFILGLFSDLNDNDRKNPFREYRSSEEISIMLLDLLKFFMRCYPATCQFISEKFSDLIEHTKSSISMVISYPLASDTSSENYFPGVLECSIVLAEPINRRDFTKQIGYQRYLIANALSNNEFETVEDLSVRLHKIFLSHEKHYLRAVFVYFSPVHIFSYDFMAESSKASLQALQFVEHVLKHLNDVGYEHIRNRFSDFNDFFMTLFPATRDLFYQYKMSYREDDELTIVSHHKPSEEARIRIFEKSLRMASEFSPVTYRYQGDFRRTLWIGGLSCSRYSSTSIHYHHDKNDRLYEELNASFSNNLPSGNKSKYFARVVDYFSLKQHEKKYHSKVQREAYSFVSGLISDLNNHSRVPTGIFFRQSQDLLKVTWKLY